MMATTPSLNEMPKQATHNSDQSVRITSLSPYDAAVSDLTKQFIEQANRQHWQTAKRWTFLLLLCWALMIFIVGFASSAWAFPFFGWSFPFWVGAQGSLIVFVVLVVVYTKVMNRADVRRQKLIEHYTGSKN